MKRFALALSLLLAAIPARAQDAASMAAAQAANNFYTTLRAIQPAVSGLPKNPGRFSLMPLFSRKLTMLVISAGETESKFAAKFMTAKMFVPPLLTGDLFSSLPEAPASFRVGACTGTASAQRCRILFNRPLTPGGRGPARPAEWNDDLLLVNEGGWKVDDVDYRGGFVGGNTGLLSQTLAMVIRTGP